MKKTLLPVVALLLSANLLLAGNWFGPGPWANGTYYPGNLDGKYQAAVSGVNTAGVLGFAIRDGAPPFLQTETQSLSDAALISDTVAVNQEIQLDRSLNYYAIFVNGRTYTGTTAAGVNYQNSSVFGSLIGTQPTTLTNSNNVVTTQLVTNVTVTNSTSTIISNGTPTTIIVSFTNTSVETVSITNTVLNPVLIATGADGSFQASVTGNRGIFTFQGPGQLTSPGQITNNQQINITNAFNVNGIRTSFSSESVFQQVNTGPAQGAP
jgi:hypothetical protein